MSVSISPNAAAEPLISAPRSRFATPDQGSERRNFSLARQLVVIREMLETIDTLTVPGKRHTMRKVVEFVENHVADAALAMSSRNQHMLAELVRRLAHESDRLSPDVPVFVRRAKSLVALLSAVA